MRKEDREITSEFKLIKTSHYKSEEKWEKHVDKFFKLQGIKSIGRIKIPSFTFVIDKLTIILEMTYQPGMFVGAKYNHILWEDLVMNQDEYTFVDYSLNNFVHCNGSDDIYCVDLHCYSNTTTLEERIESWKKQRQRRILSPTGWSPVNLLPSEKLLQAEAMLLELPSCL